MAPISGINGVCWLTGLSCTGKTTLSKAIYNEAKKEDIGVVLLDGDQVRSAFGSDLSYTVDDRIIQFKRLQNISKILSEQGLLVIVAALYSTEKLLFWNRGNFNNYFEIYLTASTATLNKRDIRGIYDSASNRKFENVVGKDIPWIVPKNPDLIINTDDDPDPAISASEILMNLKEWS